MSQQQSHHARGATAYTAASYRSQYEASATPNGSDAEQPPQLQSGSQDRDDELQHRSRKKRITMRSAAEESSSLMHSHSSGHDSAAAASARDYTADADSDDDEDDDPDLPRLKGWPTWLRLRREARLFWLQLRLVTVLKFLCALLVAWLLVRWGRAYLANRNKSTHFSIVALMRDMSPAHFEMQQQEEQGQDPERWSFAFQWTALSSWSAQLAGRNILVFVDREASCDFVEQAVKDIQCFVIPPECFHPEYKKPRLDCVFPVAHAHSPTETMVYVNGDVVIGSDLGRAISVVQSKQAHQSRFLMTGQRTDLPVSAEMVAHYRAPDFVAKILEAAAESGHLHAPDALDLFVYQRGDFQRKAALRDFPPFLAGAAHWDAWLLSQAVLDDSIVSIDMSSSVMLVHLERGKSLGQHSAPRVGAPYNEDLARRVSGNSWKVGASVSNCEMALIGNCALGAANVQVTPNGDRGAAATADSDASAAAPASSTSQRISQNPPALLPDAAALSAGCYLVSNPNVTDLVLFTRRASPQGFLAVLAVNSAYLSLALNWLCWAERIRFTNFVMLAEDVASAVKLRARGVPVIVARGAPEVASPPQMHGSPLAFEQAMLIRSEFLSQVLQAGFHFLAADVDALWIDDPLPFLHPSADLQSPPLTSSTGEGAGGGGILAVRSTTYGRYFWNRVLDCQRRNIDAIRSLAAAGTPFDADQYSSASCLQAQTQLMAQQAAFTRVELDPLLFPSGSSFFEQHDSQLRGIMPIVIHNSGVAAPHAVAGAATAPVAEGARMLSVSEKLERVTTWGLAALDPDTSECVLGSPLPLPDLRMASPTSGSSGDSAPIADFKLKIRVLTYNRPKSLERLLASLAAADYDGDKVSLEISVDHPTPSPSDDDLSLWSETTVLAQSFDWRYGSKLVVEQVHNIGIVGQWLHGWVPAAGDDNELCLFLEDDVAVTPGFYLWLRQAVRTYYLNPANYDPRLFGISLQKQHAIVGESRSRRFGSRTPGDVLDRMALTTPVSADSLVTHLYKYQLLGTWGMAFFPQHWRRFLSWIAERRVDTIQGTSPLGAPCVPSFVSNKWWMKQPSRQWTAWFVRFAFEQGWYGLVGNYAEGSFAVNHREPGVGSKLHAKGPAYPGIMDLVPAVHLDFPSPARIPVFDFHFSLVRNPGTLAFRRALASEKFLAPLGSDAAANQAMQCWTMEELDAKERKEREERRAIERIEAAKAAEAAEKARVIAEAEAAAAAIEAAAAAAEAKKNKGVGSGSKKKADSKGSGSKAAANANAKGSGSKKGSGSGKGSSAAPPVDPALLASLTSLAQLSQKEIDSTYFAESSSSLLRDHFLSGALKPLVERWQKSKWMTLGEGAVFGAAARWIQGVVDPEAKVSASSEATDATLQLAKKHKLLSLSGSIAVLDPTHLTLAPQAVDWFVSINGGLSSRLGAITELLRVARKGVVLLERHATKLEGTKEAGAFSAELAKALTLAAAPPAPVAGEPAYADALALYRTVREQKSVATLLFKVFSDPASTRLQQAAKVAPNTPPMMATLILKKAPSPSQLAALNKIGYIAVTIE